MLKKGASRHHNDQGFTLLELLIAIAILSIGLLAVASMQATAIKANTIADVNTMATTVAQQVMEDLMSTPIQSYSVIPNTQYWYTQFNLGVAIPQTYNRFPPINNGAVPPAGKTTLLLNGSNTFTAKYTMTPNTPVQYVTQVSVSVYQSPPLLDIFGQPRPNITFIGYRSVPQ